MAVETLFTARSCGAQGVADMAAVLTAVLRNPRTSPAEATEATRHLLLLQAEGAPCMEHADPIQLYLNTQVVALKRGRRACLVIMAKPACARAVCADATFSLCMPWTPSARQLLLSARAGAARAPAAGA